MIKNIFSLSFGLAFYQVLAFISLPYFSLHYKIESFATYGLYGAVLSMLSVWSTARFNQVVLVVKTAPEVYKAVIVGICFCILFSILCFCILQMFSDSYYTKFLLLSLISLGTFEMFSSIVINENKHKYISFVFLVYGSITVTVQFSLIGYRENGVLEGKIIGDLILLLLCTFYIIRYLSKNRKYFELDINQYIDFFKKNSAYLLLGCPQGFLSSFARNLPLLILPSYDKNIAGYFAIFYKLIAAPIDFLAKPIRQLILNIEHSKITIEKLSRLSQYFYILAVFIAGATLLFYQIDLLDVFGGEEVQKTGWYPYSIFIPLLLIVLVQVLIYTPVKTLMINLSLQRELLFSEIIFSMFKLGSIILYFELLNPYTALILYLVSLVIVDNIFAKLLIHKLRKAL